MAKMSSVFVCQQCGYQSPSFLGKCPNCDSWNSLVETVTSKRVGAIHESPQHKPIKLSEINTAQTKRISTGIAELDRVLGGGLVPGMAVLLAGEPGIGKCVTGDTRILDPQTGAYLQITDWETNLHSVLSLDKDTLRLFSNSALAFHNHGVKKVVNIKTRLGRSLICTPSHPVFTPGGWQNVEDLKPKDRIASPRSLPFFGQEVMSESEIKLIAYILSDGSAGSQISVTSALPEVEDDLKNIANEFGVPVKTYLKRNNIAKQYRFTVPWHQKTGAREKFAAVFNKTVEKTGLSIIDLAKKAQVDVTMLKFWISGESVPGKEELERLVKITDSDLFLLEKLAGISRLKTPIALFLEQNGLRGLKAASKRVPDRIFKLPKNGLALFLKILFSCDGSVYMTKSGNCGLSYSTVSKKLAEDVAHLLLRFGFISKLRFKKFGAYEIQMLGITEVKRFLAEIGIWGRSKAIEEINKLPSPKIPSTHYDTIPTGTGFWQKLNKISNDISFKKMSALTGVTMHYHRDDRPLCRKTVESLSKFYDSPELKLLVDNDIYWDEVKSITPAGERTVYDISVSEHENFVANDLIIHNSTLLLELADKLPSVLYIAGEESASQIKIRADRLKIKSDNLEILEETDADNIVGAIHESPVQLIIIDSIQTLTTGDLSGTAGSVGQVRECAARLISRTKELGLPLILVGHVTKDGTIAGPKVLEHIVDTVLTIEGDKYSSLRIVRTSKNRFGPTDEVGIFEMRDSGLVAVEPGLPDVASAESGSCLTIIMEGTRPILAEVQALVTSTPIPNPRRVASGVDHNRLLTICAILQKRLNIPLYKEDVYVSVSGGLKITEPAGDLAIALAILSSYRNKPLPPKSIAFGELDLLGNVRRVSSEEKRAKEAKLRGLTHRLSTLSI